MKLKRIASLCSSKGVFYLMDQVDQEGAILRQWLGDGYASYPLEGLPYLDTENLCAMFDISDAKQEKCGFYHKKTPASLNMDDIDEGEREVAMPKLYVRYNGMDLLPLETSLGVIFIQSKYLSPVDDSDYLRLFERHSKNGGVYIAAKNGMLIQAVIMPVEVVTQDFVDQLDTLSYQSAQALERKELRREPEEDKDQGTLFQVDFAAGKVLPPEEAGK